MYRCDGFESVNARSLAKRMGYSVQPIYSYFDNMDALKEAVSGEAMKFYNEFIYSRKPLSPLSSRKNNSLNRLVSYLAKATLAFAILSNKLSSSTLEYINSSVQYRRLYCG